MTLVRRRAGHRAQVTQLLNRSVEELSRDVLCSDTLSAIRRQLLHHRETILNLDCEILDSLTEDTEITEEISDTSDFVIKLDATTNKLD